MDPSDYLSVVAIVISMTAILTAGYFSLRTLTASRRPVLVLESDGRTGWLLRNIGNGPGLNILIAQKRVGGGWFNPVRVPPLARNAEMVLKWLHHMNDAGIGATYEDFKGDRYSTTCGNDLSQTYLGSILPAWEEEEIGRHWSHVDVERLLDTAIQRGVRHPEFLNSKDRLSFDLKVDLARALGVLPERMVSAIRALNGLRNRVVHTDDFRPSLADLRRLRLDWHPMQVKAFNVARAKGLEEAERIACLFLAWRCIRLVASPVKTRPANQS